MTILLLKGYNNYFNRILKQETDITTYKTASTSYLEYPNVNFNPNDGIATSLVVGSEGQLDNGEILKFDNLGNPDYLIVHDNVNIKSRWFIIESVKIRSGQYKLTLKRDVLVDFFNEIKDSPCYIEKASITDLNNPLLYNKEGLQVNQIKKAEHLLKDTSKVAWVVGYVASNLTSEVQSGNFGTISLDNQGLASGSILYAKSNSIVKMWLSNVSGDTVYAIGNNSGTRFTYSIDPLTNYITYSINIPELANQAPVLRYDYTLGSEVASDNYRVNLAGDSTRAHVEDAPYDMFCIPFGEITLNGANITTTKEAALEIAFEFSKDISSFLYDIQLLPYCPRPDMVVSGKIYEVLGSSDIDYSYIYQGNTIKSILLWCKKSTHSIYVQPDEDINIERKVDEHTYGKEETYTGTVSRLLLNPDYVQISVTNDNLKDLVNIDITGVTVMHSSGYNVATQATTDKVYNPETGYLTFRVYDGGDEEFTSGSLYNASIKLSYEYQKYVNPKYLDWKISNECDIYRLVSPNYNGQFEWSLAKGAGTATIFDADITYKPFQPYIHINPTFTGLYGSDFDDARGLICGGNFSLPVVNDAWVQYQIQNKTYQDMFDRQIQHMDKQWELDSNRAGLLGAIGVGQATIAGAGGGASIGGKLGGGTGGMIGAGIGAVAGATLSSLGMAADMTYNQEVFAENRSFAYDQFNYNLQNIQALPYSLTKVAAYTANNKIFPMVEYYSCTDIEKEAFKNKLKYNGMSVNVIGKIEDYIDNSEKRYIKAQLIRLEDIEDDSHIANEIYNELYKGVFI